MATSWLKVRYLDDSPPWKSELTSDRGYIAISCKKFVPGSFICSEYPTVTVSGWHPFTESQVEEINNKVNALPDSDKQAFFEMANAFPENSSVAAGIFMTNAFDMVDSPLGKESGMYCALARLNHSCIPNAQQTHIPSTSEEVLYASRCIEIGDEINDCYIDLRQSREHRRKELLNLYRFKCECLACEQEGELLKCDDRNRTRAKQLDDNILLAAENDPYQALDIAHQLLNLLEKDDCRGWSERYIADCHLSIYLLAESIGDHQKMRRHIDLCHQLNIKLQGPTSPDSLKSFQLMRDCPG